MDSTTHLADAGTKAAMGPPAPIHATPIDYFTPAVDRGPERWVVVARLATTAQWHQARAALGRAQIDALMGEGQDATSHICHAGEGIALLVIESQADRATIILKHCVSGRRWCPRCGSSNLRTVPVPWTWMLWSVLFLGLAPFAPPRWECRNCGRCIR